MSSQQGSSCASAPCAISCGCSSIVHKRQQRQNQYYDHGTNPLLPLKQGDGGWYNQRNQLKKATVVQWCPEPHRSYWIQTEHGVLRRNRQQLQKSLRNTNRGYNHLFDDEEDVEASSSNNQQLLVPVSAENCTATSSGRRILPPPRFCDFVMWLFAVTFLWSLRAYYYVSVLFMLFR